MYTNDKDGELNIYCNVYLPSTNAVNIEDLTRYDNMAIHEISRLKAAIKSIEGYRVKLYKQAQKVNASPSHKLIELKRQPNYATNKIFYYVKVCDVMDAFKETYTRTNKITRFSQSFAGAERHKAIKAFEELKKQYPQAEIKDFRQK